MIFGNLGNLGEMMKQAQKMQGELKKIKDELKHARYEAESSGVKVVVDGEMEIKDVRILGGQDIGKLGETIKHAANKALKQAKEDAANRLKGAAGGLNLPGLT